jgi:hypothetical protein
MRTQSLEDFCNWIEQTPLSVSIQSTPWVVPTVQTIHILAIAALLISAVMINLQILSNSGADQPLSRVFTRYVKIIWLALPILFISGVLLITGEPARSLANDVFQIKMFLLACAIIITLVLQKRLSDDSLYWESTPPRRQAARFLAIISTVCWLAIICAGRWIAYTYS